jgi:hypothetical protein
MPSAYPLELGVAADCPHRHRPSVRSSGWSRAVSLRLLNLFRWLSLLFDLGPGELAFGWQLFAVRYEQ